jgi:hypothetical protein
MVTRQELAEKELELAKKLSPEEKAEVRQRMLEDLQQKKS